MRLADVDDDECGAVAVRRVELFQAPGLFDERRSGVASEDQDDGTLVHKRRQANLSSWSLWCLRSLRRRVFLRAFGVFGAFDVLKTKELKVGRWRTDLRFLATATEHSPKEAPQTSASTGASSAARSSARAPISGSRSSAGSNTRFPVAA